MPSAAPRSGRSGRLGPRSGQTLVESCIVIILISLIFFGILQLSQIFAAQEVLDYAAGRGARAKTVGLNDFMVHKTVRIGSIPNAGLLEWPDVPGGPADQYEVESSRIPFFLGAQSYSELRPILHYTNWHSVTYDVDVDPISSGMDILRVRAEQDYPLWVPFHRAFYAGDTIEMEGNAVIESHFSLYMDEGYW